MLTGRRECGSVVNRTRSGAMFHEPCEMLWWQQPILKKRKYWKSLVLQITIYASSFCRRVLSGEHMWWLGHIGQERVVHIVIVFRRLHTCVANTQDETRRPRCPPDRRLPLSRTPPLPHPRLPQPSSAARHSLRLALRHLHQAFH